MSWPDSAELLAGPRGRRLCWSLVAPDGHPGWDRVRDGASAGDLTGLTGEVAACVARTDLGAIAASTGELALLPALAEPVATAMYWQEPDDEDRVLAAGPVREALLPVAEVVAAAPAARWWATPLAAGRQQYVEWLGGFAAAPVLTGAAAELAKWRAGELDDERSAGDRPDDPEAPWSGHWWSIPAHSRLPSTTRSVPGLGAVRLALAEDPLGWTQARCWPVEPRPDARIYEVSGPREWAELVGRYPLDATKSRRHDWWRATGRDGRWLIPDFAAVAADYDAVHVSVVGYLVTAGRAVPVDGACTVLAGWDPDQAYWLTDALTLAGPAADWVRLDQEPLGWFQERTK